MTASDEQTPTEALTGAFVVLQDEDNAERRIAWFGGEIVGVIDPQIAGRWTAWTPKAGTRNGVLGVFTSIEEAAQAVRDLYEPKTAEESDRNCATVLGGGATHAAYDGDDDDRVSPLCRMGGQNNRLTHYRIVTGDVTCKTCTRYREIRARRAG